MSTPRVFVSYSHDNSQHKKWVLNLSKNLIKDGIDVLLDQWNLEAGQDIPHFMEESISISDYVLMICSKNYVSKANEGRGGVGYEKMILTSDYLKGIDEGIVLPIIRNNPSDTVPTFVSSKFYLNFNDDSDYEFNYDELVRTIHDSPRLIKPEIGEKPTLSNDNDLDIDLKKESGLKTVMELISEIYNGTSNLHVSFDTLHRNSPFHKIQLELILKDAYDLGLIDWSGKRINITEEGRIYIVNNKLI
ncbi:toll/interleukin-1 receptor domain-containing protein [Gracilimonas sp.]|uniref:toll/interleukin-1 receptor domain-containing protein n=1 Tax=Gracilimonas sp. TaxID=1974203 RepID=UPI0028729B67|nr:toll/interleukin-1 receptor domain-containing protein [Gracilimonas sp.]